MACNSLRLALALVLLAPALPAVAQAGEELTGTTSYIAGVTRRSASFGPRQSFNDWMELSFSEDRFSAAAVSGSYRLKKSKLRFQVDPIRLEEYAEFWETSFFLHLSESGRFAESVDCRVKKARVKGRLRDGEIKFKSSYKIRCEAEGDFGVVDAKARVRFRGKGRVSHPLPPRPGVVPISSLGLGWNFQMIAVGREASQGSAGAEVQMVGGGHAGLVIHSTVD